MTIFNHTNWFSWVFKTLPSCNSCAARRADHHHNGTQGGAMENKASLHTHLLAQTDCSYCKKQPLCCCEVSNYMGLPLPYNMLSYTAHDQLNEDNVVPIFWGGLQGLTWLLWVWFQHRRTRWGFQQHAKKTYPRWKTQQRICLWRCHSYLTRQVCSWKVRMRSNFQKRKQLKTFILLLSVNKNLSNFVKLI